MPAKKRSKKNSPKRKSLKKPMRLHSRTAKLAKVDYRHADTLVDAQSELYDLIKQANEDWLVRVDKERAMASELVTKLSAARSLPDVAKVHQESMLRRTEMIAEDGRNLFANSQKFMSAAVRLLSNGLPGRIG